MTCCFFSSLKTLLMPTEAIGPLVRVNVPGFIVGRFEVTFIGRFWVATEAPEPWMKKQVNNALGN